MNNKAVFLDRDGTLLEEVHYLAKTEDMRWIPGVREALARLYKEGWLLIIVTNQSGIARGYFTQRETDAIYEQMQRDLQSCGAEFAHMYCCPHHPEYSRLPEERNCSCRKPLPGMFLQAQREFGLNMTECAAFGDRLRDLSAPADLGCRCFLVQSGYGPKEAAKLNTSDYAEKIEICRTFSEGAERLLRQ
ncbi:HAD family hydrolase [bacterium]|nr:HAD family hydrolase [bacterium]